MRRLLAFAVIHDCDDEQALRALGSCRRAMGPHGTLLPVEQVVPPGDTPGFRRDWERRYPNTPWDRAREAIRDAWEDATS